MGDNAQNGDYVELEDKYIIKKEIDRNGDISIILLVEDKCTHKIYVAKIHSKKDYEFLIDKEINIFELLNKISNKSQYIVKFIEHGEGNLIMKDIKQQKKNILF